MFASTAFFLDLVIEFLNVCRCEGRELLVSDESLDLMFDHGAIGVKCTVTNGEYHILVQPFIQPLAECHSAFFGKVNVTVEVKKLMELLECAFLRFCECRLIYG